MRFGNPLQWRRRLLAISLTGLTGLCSAMTQEEIDAMARDAHAYSQSVIQRAMRSQKDMLDTAGDAARGMTTAGGPVNSSGSVKTTIFASWSMGESAIIALAQSLKGEENVAIAFRGVPDGMTLADFMRKLASIASRADGKVALLIDPPSFQKFHVTSVPTILMEREGEMLISVRGVSSKEYLERALAAGKKGDIGADGATRDIAERDLVEVLKERAAKLDFAQIKSRAMDNFWKRQKFYSLPPASKSEVRTIDPTVTSTVDMRDANGTLLVPAGASVNPLERMPFSQRVVIFDPSSKKQLDFARSQVISHGSRQRVTLIATSLDASRAPDQLEDLRKFLGLTVTVLTPEIAERFKIRYTPSVITADRRVFSVEEMKID